MHIRFVVHRLDPDSGRRVGLSQAMAELKRNGELSLAEQKDYDEIYEWFCKNLEKPSSFTRSSKPHAKKVAISWFKTEATEHIARMYEVARILHAHGVQVETIKTERPGYVVYEDKYQVAAEPFKETTT